MPNSSPGSVTLTLSLIQAGEPAARTRLFDLVYKQLLQIAVEQTSGERKVQAEPSSVLHAALVSILGSPQLFANAHDRTYFFGAIAKAIRRVLVDRARERNSLKRGGGQQPISLDNLVDSLTQESVDVVELWEALEALEQVHERSCQVITLRVLGGFTAPEVAAQLGVSISTIEKDTQFARAWLYDKLGGDS